MFTEFKIYRKGKKLDFYTYSKTDGSDNVVRDNNDLERDLRTYYDEKYGANANSSHTIEEIEEQLVNDNYLTVQVEKNKTAIKGIAIFTACAVAVGLAGGTIIKSILKGKEIKNDDNSNNLGYENPASEEMLESYESSEQEVFNQVVKEQIEANNNVDASQETYENTAYNVWNNCTSEERIALINSYISPIYDNEVRVYNFIENKECTNYPFLRSNCQGLFQEGSLEYILLDHFDMLQYQLAEICNYDAKMILEMEPNLVALNSNLEGKSNYQMKIYLMSMVRDEIVDTFVMLTQNPNQTVYIMNYAVCWNALSPECKILICNIVESTINETKKIDSENFVVSNSKNEETINFAETSVEENLQMLLGTVVK